MTRAAGLARWLAIAVAAAAVLDPLIRLPHTERPVVRVVSHEARDIQGTSALLKKAGFIIDPAAAEAATVLIASRPADRAERSTLTARTPDPALWALDTAPQPPNVRVARVNASASRLPGEAIDVDVVLEADGVGGKTTELLLEHSRIPVATTRHQWTDGERRWPVSLRYLPPGVAATPLRVRAVPIAGEKSVDDNAADVAVPPTRGAIRTLILEAAVTWPAIFVRRALEGDPAFAVSSLQRAAKGVATRAGSPPAALTRAALAPFEVALLGGPDLLTAADLEALRWFVEERGGVAIFVPDQRPSGSYVHLLGVSAFAPRALDAPVRLGARLLASELLIPASLPPAATVVAAADGRPVVFSARRGSGAVVFSGALDAWRNRAAAPEGGSSTGSATDSFAEFWRELIVTTAAGVPPAIDVSVEPAIARPGERTRIAVRVRASEIPSGETVTMPSIAARVVGPAVHVDESVRLWPTAEPGVFEGEWRAGVAGQYNVAAIAGDLRGDGSVAVVEGAAHASTADPEALALAASASGGQVFPIDRAPALVDAMTAAYPARRIWRSARPMRSPWWVVPFAGLLCAEWAMRRKRGLP